MVICTDITIGKYPMRDYDRQTRADTQIARHRQDRQIRTHTHTQGNGPRELSNDPIKSQPPSSRIPSPPPLASSLSIHSHGTQKYTRHWSFALITIINSDLIISGSRVVLCFLSERLRYLIGLEKAGGRRRERRGRERKGKTEGEERGKGKGWESEGRKWKGIDR